jgi:uncharacterized membrane protein YqiK
VRVVPSEPNGIAASSKTNLKNVDVVSQFGIFDVMVDDQKLDIGTVVKAKGTVSEFRGNKQLDLKRIWVVPTTDEEAQAWAETAAFKQKVLSQPWHLTSAEHKQIKKQIKSEKKKMLEYEKRKAEHEAKKRLQEQERDMRRAQREKKLESRRRREETMMNAGALL